LLCALAAEPQPLLVAAASDLSPLRDQLTSAIAQSTGIPVRFTFAGSGILARQIENGAPYDLYLSANQQFVRQLDERGKLLRGASAVYAVGHLGLWSKSGKVRKIADIQGTIALPNPVHAPYGAAAVEMLKRLGEWPRLQAKVVYGENVVQAFQFVQSGNADACITSWSLGRDQGAILLPATDYPPIRQTGAVVASSKRKEEARRVLEFFLSPAGKKILTAGGLGTP
jgi:molybdate transport system substrate-binding protein